MVPSAAPDAAWTFTNGQTINHAWNATLNANGSSITATNVDHNGALGAGASTTFEFIATWNGSNSAPSVSCTAS
jgi:mannan endo-1,4-beta-mannosidase